MSHSSHPPEGKKHPSEVQKIPKKNARPPRKTLEKKIEELQAEIDKLRSVRGNPLASEEQFALLFGSIDEAFCIIEVLLDEKGRGIDYRYIATNPAFPHHTGLGEVIRKRASEIIPTPHQSCAERYGRIALTGKPERFVERSEGMGRWFDVRAFPLGDPAEGMVGVLFSDITEQKQMEERTRHLASFPQLNPNAILEIDLSGRVIYHNLFAEKILENAGMDRLDLTPFLPGDIKDILDDWDGRKESWVEREITIGKREFSEIISFAPDFGVAHIFARDVTHRKSSEKALKESRNLFYTVLNNVDAAIYVADMDTFEILFVNEFMKRIFGDVTGQTCWKALLKEQEGPCPFCTNSRLLTSLGEPAGPITWEFYNPVVGHWIQCHDRAIKWLDGRIVRIQIATNITDLKRMEEELQKSRDELEQRVEKRTAELQKSEEMVLERLAEIEGYYDTAPVGIAILDRQQRYIRVNQKLAAMNGIPAEDHIGRTVGDVVSKTLADWQETMVDRVLESGETIRDVELTHGIAARPGVEMISRASLFPIKNSENRAVAIGLIVEDITEKKRIEEELRQFQKMEALGTLAGGIAHDFNNMLAIIMGNAELALEDVQEAEPRRNLEAILRASKRSRDLVRQILTFSRRSGIEEKPVDMIDMVKDTQQLLRSSLPAGIRMDVDIRTTSAMVMGDPSKVQQVILNLAGNAADAMRKRGGVLTLRLSTVERGTRSPFIENESGSYVKLTVQDTGTGISPEVRRRIFEPFFTTKEPGQGTGMGLSVVYGIVKGFEGMIEVESEVGRGTTFDVLLPQAYAAATDQWEAEEVEMPGKGHILLVDDEEAFVEMAAPVLKRLGYRVTSATDSVKAMGIFIVSPEAFDLVITDQTMPEFTGIELATEVRRIRKDLPVILCTGYSEVVSPETALRAGVAEFLMKPVSRKQMARAIRRALDKGKERNG